MSKVYPFRELLNMGVTTQSVERVAADTSVADLARAATALHGMPVVVLTDRPKEWLSRPPSPGADGSPVNVLEFGADEARACGEVVDGLVRRGRRFGAIADIDYRDNELVAETVTAMMRNQWLCRVIVRAHLQDWQDRRPENLAEARVRSLDERLTGCLAGTIVGDGELVCEMPQLGWELADA